MSILYSNIPLTKETSQETILDMYTASDETVSIVDKTSETYKNKKKLIRDFSFVKKPFNEYQIQLHNFVSGDNTVLGLFIAEGFDFQIGTRYEPIFKMEKHNIDLSLKGFYDKTKQANKIMVGIFLVGTSIYYKLNGRPFKDTLTKDGWVSKNKTESVSDVSEIANNINAKNYNPSSKLEAAKALMEQKEIPVDLYERYKIFLTGEYDKLKKGVVMLNTITVDEMNLLKEKGL